MVQFATMKPAERLASIRRGLNVLNYAQSEYALSFGLDISSEPEQLLARVLEPPTIMYSRDSRQPQIVSAFVVARRCVLMGFFHRNPNLGLGTCEGPYLCSCVMFVKRHDRVDKKFWRASAIKKWALVIFEGNRRFTMEHANNAVRGIIAGADKVGQYTGRFHRLILI